LASLERKGWIECITDRRGRVYALTAVGGRIVDEMPESVEKIKEFIDKLLKV
jgi:DNA-binding PadR family transcriptional regulator